MNLRLLEIFQEVCQTESITKAARNLHMTQPAVSQAILTLEQDTGLLLFDRLSRRIYLTEMGKEYLDKVQPLLELCRNLENSTKNIQQSAPLRVGCCLTIAQYWLPEIQKEFQLRCQNPVKTTIAGAKQTFELLQNNKIDIALYEGPSPIEPYTSEIFSSYQLVPVCSDKHPFANSIVSVEEFLLEPLLLREPGSAMRDVLDSFLRLQGLEAYPVVTSITSAALLEQCRANLGITIMPDCIFTSKIDNTGLATFKVDGMNLKNDTRIVYHRDKIVTSAMQIYLDLVRQI